MRRSHIDGERIPIEAEPTASSGECPLCRQPPSSSRHSRYVRVLADRPLRVRLTVSRYYYRTALCPHLTVAEQIPLVTRPHRQRLVRLETVMAAFSAPVGGEVGARLIRRSGGR